MSSLFRDFNSSPPVNPSFPYHIKFPKLSSLVISRRVLWWACSRRILIWRAAVTSTHALTSKRSSKPLIDWGEELFRDPFSPPPFSSPYLFWCPKIQSSWWICDTEESILITHQSKWRDITLNYYENHVLSVTTAFVMWKWGAGESKMHKYVASRRRIHSHQKKKKSMRPPPHTLLAATAM